MSLEQAVVQLEQTNAALQEEVVRFRDAAMGLNAIYPTITEGRQNTADGKYFSVPGGGAYMRLYRRTGSSASLIAEYPSRESVVEAINEASTDAEARANAAADRAEVYADNKEFVTLERFRKQATLDLDFGAGDYSVDDGDKVRSTNATDLLTVERATPKWVEGPNGKLREVPPNTIAREWRNGVPQGVLIEESRTNLLLWSEDFTQGVWTKSSTAVIESAVAFAPDGTQSASRFTVDDSTFQGIEQEKTLPSGQHTLSLFVRPDSLSTVTLRFGSNRVVFNMSDVSASVSRGTVDGFDIEPMGNGWFRLSITKNSDAGDELCGIAPGQLAAAQAGSIYIWGAQIEVGTHPSSYIPTEDAPVTRAEDNVYRELGEEFNPTEGTLFADIRFPNTAVESGTNYALQLSDAVRTLRTTNSIIFWRLGSENERLRIVFFGESESVKFQILLSDPASASIAVSWDASTVRFAIDGQAQSNPLVEFDPAAFIYITSEVSSGGDRSRNLQTVKYIPLALSEQELIELTS